MMAALSNGRVEEKRKRKKPRILAEFSFLLTILNWMIT